MPATEWNQEIEACSANRADRPLADAVRLRSPDWRLENLQTQAPDGFVEPGRKLGVSIADQETIRMISRDDFPELLPSPIGCGMLGHIEVENPPSRMLDDDKDVKNLERRGYGREKVAGNDDFGMIPNERRPPLVGNPSAGSAAWTLRHVLADRAR